MYVHEHVVQTEFKVGSFFTKSYRISAGGFHDPIPVQNDKSLIQCN